MSRDIVCIFTQLYNMQIDPLRPYSRWVFCINQEAEVEEKKRYWLKLDKNFLKSPHIKVIKDMTNGKDYVIFYLALMLESIETVGHLRFSDLVPYDEKMLASLTDTNIDIVRSAVKIFCQLGLMEFLDDGTIYLNQVAQMTGKECESAERVRKFREKHKSLQCNTTVTICNDNKEKDKHSIETENNKEEVNTSLVPNKIRYEEIDVEFTELLYSLMKNNNPNIKEKTPAQKVKDYEEMNRLRRLDNREDKAVKFIIKWCQQDSFWKSNILSVGKLRIKFDQLYMKAESEYNKRRAVNFD